MSRYRLISNNPLMKLGDLGEVEFLNENNLQLFLMVRGEIEKGYKLVTHPLTGSIRPDITPYKSILLSKKKDKDADLESMKLINNAIRYTNDLYKLRSIPLSEKWGDEFKEDFQFVDKDFIRYAYERSI